MSYYYSFDAYSAILNSFRTSDLQALLGAFGQNRACRKNELKERALDLLRNRQPHSFNHQVYCQKILEIYQSMQNDVPNIPNNLLRSIVHTQQRQIVDFQSRKRTFPPPRYPQQQPMHLSLPQVMPQMSRMYANNLGSKSSRIQYGYQPVLPRNVPQMSSGQQLPLFTPLNNIKFRNWPFYDLICEIIKPTILISQNGCTLQTEIEDLKEFSYKFQLSTKHASEIGMNRDLSQGKMEYSVQLHARICSLEPGQLEISDLLPLNLHVRINNKHVQLPPPSKTGTNVRRFPKSIHLSPYIKINPTIQNLITVNWVPDEKTYAIGVFLVRHLSIDTLLKRLQEKEGRSSEETKNYLIRKLANDDPDLATTSYRVSLVCPLGKMRMKIPAKFIHCDHELRCFDATTFIKMNEKKPTWTCPTCTKNCCYDDIQIQYYILDILSSPALPDSCNEIEILADGTWRLYEKSKDTKDEDAPMDNKEKPMDSVNLDDSDDETPVELKTDPIPECSKETNNVAFKSSFIDLTLSDDDDEGTTKSKQENEAQAADAAQIPTTVDKKTQAQVQPKQAVTNSEEVDVIEIDSPTLPSILS